MKLQTCCALGEMSQSNQICNPSPALSAPKKFLDKQSTAWQYTLHCKVYCYEDYDCCSRRSRQEPAGRTMGTAIAKGVTRDGGSGRPVAGPALRARNHPPL